MTNEQYVETREEIVEALDNLNKRINRYIVEGDKEHLRIARNRREEEENELIALDEQAKSLGYVEEQ